MTPYLDYAKNSVQGLQNMRQLEMERKDSAQAIANANNKYFNAVKALQNQQNQNRWAFLGNFLGGALSTATGLIGNAVSQKIAENKAGEQSNKDLKNEGETSVTSTRVASDGIKLNYFNIFK